MFFYDGHKLLTGSGKAEDTAKVRGQAFLCIFGGQSQQYMDQGPVYIGAGLIAGL